MSGRPLLLPVLVLLAIGAGWFGRGLLSSGDLGREPTPISSDDLCADGSKPRYWKAPMDPTYVRKTPGRSPMGMDLVPECGDAPSATEASRIQIDPRLILNMGVRVAPVERRDMTRSIRAVGRVAYDERRVAHVHTKVQGWIEKLFVEYEGEMVERGSPLMEIYSPELLATQEELLLAERYREATAESTTEDVRSGGRSLYDATRRRLELWDIPESEISRLLEEGKARKTLTLYAPNSGVVTKMMAREGMEVTSSMNLYTIADLSTVWIYANVYEYELPWVEAGQRAIVQLSYLPGQSFEGEVIYVYPFLDPKTRTARVRVELDNPGLVFKPDMFANVEIHAESLKGVLAIPDEAVIRSGRRSIVVVDLGDGRFEPNQVVLGLDSGDGWVEVREGLTESERIVTSGQFLIDSESRLQEAVEKMLAGNEMDSASETKREPQ